MKRAARRVAVLLCVPCLTCAGARSGSDELRIREEAPGSNAFAFALYGRYARREGNLVVSPFNIAAAFSMAYGGARGETAGELRRIFRFAGTPEETPAAWGDMIADTVKGGEEKGIELDVANRLWVNERFPVRRDFASMIARHYGEKPARFRVRWC